MVLVFIRRALTRQPPMNLPSSAMKGDTGRSAEGAFGMVVPVQFPVPSIGSAFANGAGECCTAQKNANDRK